MTPDLADTAKLVWLADQALAGGARVLQYRNKAANPDLARQQADELRSLTRSHGALFIVNDSVELALASDADGVHLGREDQADMDSVRARARRPFLIGISCYNDLSLADAAIEAGADYIAFGSFFPSQVKPGAARAEPSLITAVKSRHAVPIVAIGGITIENAPQLIAAGVDAVAVITALFGAPDIAEASRRFNLLFH